MKTRTGLPSGLPILTNSIGMKLALIPSGSFMMGSLQEEHGRFPDEHIHRVVITRPFFLGIHEVTVGQFRQFVDATGHRTSAEKDNQGGQGINSSGKLATGPVYGWRSPGYEQTDSHPVVNVTWHDATAFARWLSQKESAIYRLPTEAEWEYACRAGTRTAFQTGTSAESITRAANVGDLTLRDARLEFRNLPDIEFIQSHDRFVFPAEAGQFEPNRFGLYDMTGNVCEWCSDWYDPNYYRRSPPTDPQGPANGTMRAYRGGSWTSLARFCRSGDRARYEPLHRANTIGFRVVREESSSPARSTMAGRPAPGNAGPEKPAQASPPKPVPIPVVGTTYSPQASPLPKIAFPPAAEMQPLGSESPWPSFLEPTRLVLGDEGGLRFSGRNYSRTISRSLLADDFTFELEFTMAERPEDQGIAFAGIGTAEKGSIEEPVNGAFLRIHAPALKSGVGLANRPGANVAGIGALLTNGPHLIRIRKKGHFVSFEIDADIDGPTPDDMACAVPDLKAFVPVLHEKNTHLFFGGNGLFTRVSLNTVSGPEEEKQPAADAMRKPDSESGQLHRLDPQSPWPDFLEAGTNTFVQHQSLTLTETQTVRTKARDFLDRDFVFELMLSVERDSPVARIGLGESPESNCAFLRIHSQFHASDVELSRGKRTRDRTRVGKGLPPGTHRVIIHKKGNRVQFAIDVNNDGQSDTDMQITIPDIREFEPYLHSKNTHLFFDQGAFKQVRLTIIDSEQPDRAASTSAAP